MMLFVTPSTTATLDLIELLVQHGADPASIDSDTVLWSRHPAIIRWFIAHGPTPETIHPSLALIFHRKRVLFPHGALGECALVGIL
jgi:hypothetical protein